MERDRFESQSGAWYVVTRQPNPWLRPYVTSYTDYGERISDALFRRELPTTTMSVIIGLGGPLLVTDAAGDQLTSYGSGFLAGLHTAPALTIAHGEQRGMEVRLTPLGAHRLLGLPMHELANRVVDLVTLLGPDAACLIDRLQHLPTPASRLDRLEHAIERRFAAADPPDPALHWAWRQLRQSHGGVEIATLATELGWSQKRLIARFRAAVGAPPKTVARVLRFERTVALLPGADAVDWAGLAHQGGYYDQSHLVREFRHFAGCTPTQLHRERLATSFGPIIGTSAQG